jgi:hypothetical protein
MMTTLYKVECEADGFSEALVEFARARSPQQAAEIIHDFFLHETDDPVRCRRFTVQLLREPDEGVGLDQFLDQAGHRGPGDSGQAADLGAAQRARRREHVDDGAPVVLAQVLERAAMQVSHGRSLVLNPVSGQMF